MLALYFAYGSNMDASQMVRRVPSASLVEIGELEGYDVVFNRQGTYRSGGVASLEPAQGKSVFGAVWSLDEAALPTLDRIEDPAAYRRELLSVRGLSGKTYRCFVYRSIPQGPVEPDKEYLRLIIDAAESLKLPNHYIRRLREFE